MEKINSFISKFCNLHLENVHKVGRRYYQVAPELWKEKESVDRDVYHIGTFLGEAKKEFIPSLELIDMIAKKSNKKLFVNDKGEWMFQCKRDVFEENIIKKNVSKGLCLVQNSKDENIGYGVLNRNNLKPILDRGDFLRRE